jgi:formate-dependent nitrite reductase membrane component NrfD
MTSNSRPDDRASEDRLDAIKEEARRTGRVSSAGADVAGGPIPTEARTRAGYYGLPIVKPPVWTWQVGAYFFVGGAAGMSGVIAFAALVAGEPIDVVRSAIWIAVAGAAASPCLLIWDLGRPARFLNMLRVFKWRSAMSVGVWTLVAFSVFAGATMLAVQAMGDRTSPGRVPPGVLVLAAGMALTGSVLATYTGVLLGATSIPVWFAHHRLLPVHFGIIGLGSAAALLELLGFQLAPLNAIGLAVSAAETCIGVAMELRRGVSSALLRGAWLLTGPAALLLRLADAVPVAAGALIVGAILSRYGWLLAGHLSALDPEATLRSQRQP